MPLWCCPREYIKNTQQTSSELLEQLEITLALAGVAAPAVNHPLPIPASLWICADSLKARTRDYHNRKVAFPLANTTLSTQYRSPGKQEESSVVLYKMIPIQLGAGTFCTWQPVPAAVKNSWRAEAPSRAVNVITAVSTGASLLCMNKIWTVPLPWGFMWCIAPKCTAAHSPGTQQNYFSFLCFLKPI